MAWLAFAALQITIGTCRRVAIGFSNMLNAGGVERQLHSAASLNSTIRIPTYANVLRLGCSLLQTANNAGPFFAFLFLATAPKVHSGGVSMFHKSQFLSGPRRAAP